MYDYKLLPSAKQDVINAFNWYEKESKGLGYRFMQELASEIKKIDNPLIKERRVFRDFQKHTCKKFPFYIYYKKDDGKKLIIIFAVLHKKQDSSEFYNRI
jgi:toxin ParE1/3/4